MSSGSAGGGVIGDVVGNIIMVIGIMILVLLIIAIWLFIKAINTIIRAIVKNPKSKALWIALAVFLLSIGLLVSLSLTQNDQTYSAITESAVGLSFVSLVITARCVELSASMTFERERGGLVQEVLHRPWWHMDDKPVEQEAALAA
jgi:hypothetical protein